MNALIITCSVALTAAFLVLIVYVIRAIQQLTLTLRQLDTTLVRTTRTLDHVDQVLEGAGTSLERLDRVIGQAGTITDMAVTLGDAVTRGTRGPVSVGAGIAMAAVRGFQAFFRKHPQENGARKEYSHERGTE